MEADMRDPKTARRNLSVPFPATRGPKSHIQLAPMHSKQGAPVDSRSELEAEEDSLSPHQHACP